MFNLKAKTYKYLLPLIGFSLVAAYAVLAHHQSTAIKQLNLGASQLQTEAAKPADQPKASVTVNGAEVPVPANGTVTTQVGSTKAEVSVTSNGTTTSTQSDQSGAGNGGSVNVNVTSTSTGGQSSSSVHIGGSSGGTVSNNTSTQVFKTGEGNVQTSP